MNISLPGWYSQRNRTFALRLLAAELYWMSALVNIRGVAVKTTRAATSRLVNLPSGSVTWLIEKLGETESSEDTATRPPLTPKVVLSPL